MRRCWKLRFGLGELKWWNWIFLFNFKVAECKKSKIFSNFSKVFTKYSNSFRSLLKLSNVSRNTSNCSSLFVKFKIFLLFKKNFSNSNLHSSFSSKYSRTLTNFLNMRLQPQISSKFPTFSIQPSKFHTSQSYSDLYHLFLSQLILMQFFLIYPIPLMCALQH